MGYIIRDLVGVVLSVIALLVAVSRADAHPHILPTVRTAITFDAQGRATAVQHTWVYDLAYSTFVKRDIDANKDGIISRDELAAFAKTQLDALAEHSYFTTAGGIELGLLTSHSIEMLADGRLQLTFTAPFKTPLARGDQIVIEIHDPSMFAYFTMSPDGVRLIGARDGCQPLVTGPQPVDLRNTRSIPSVFWQALDGSKAASLQLINRITVTCP